MNFTRKSSQPQTFDELLEQSEVKDFLFRFQRDALPRIANSECMMCVVSGAPDAKQCLEVGAAVLLNKPLILTVLKGSKVPPRLEKIADAIVEIDDFGSPEAQQLLAAAVKKVCEATV